MDDPSPDEVRNFALWERAFTEVAEERGYVGLIGALGESRFAQMTRTPLINAARQAGNEHLPALCKTFPNLAVVPLIRALRIKYVELRLGGP